MSSFDEQLLAIEKRQSELFEKEREIYKEQEALQAEKERLESLRLAENGGLPDDEVNSLKMALTIVGKAISDEDVVFGTFELVDEEPEETDAGYQRNVQHRFSIHMECGFVEDCAVGLRYTIKLKTKDEAVRAIVRAMISSTEYINEEYRSDPRNRWGVDWDFHEKIILRNPYSKEQYYKKK